MHRFFEPTIRPLLDQVRQLGTMVEVGAEKGLHTARLLPYARSRGAHLHVVDPDPLLHARFREQLGGAATLHRGLSHDVLPTIEAPDAVLLDAREGRATADRRGRRPAGSSR